MRTTASTATSVFLATCCYCGGASPPLPSIRLANSWADGSFCFDWQAMPEEEWSEIISREDRRPA